MARSALRALVRELVQGLVLEQAPVVAREQAQLVVLVRELAPVLVLVPPMQVLPPVLAPVLARAQAALAERAPVRGRLVRELCLE